MFLFDCLCNILVCLRCRFSGPSPCLDPAPGVRQELLLPAVLAPLICSDLSVPFAERLFCTDSSDAKGAVVSTHVPQSLQGTFGRLDQRKGVVPGYSQKRKLVFDVYRSMMGLRIMTVPHWLGQAPEISSPSLRFSNFAAGLQKYPLNSPSLVGSSAHVWTWTPLFTLTCPFFLLEAAWLNEIRCPGGRPSRRSVAGMWCWTVSRMWFWPCL